jgi:uncharacterized membrane protein
MMDQERRRRRHLIGALILIGLAVLNVVLLFWAYFDDEKINPSGIAIACILMSLAVVNLSKLKREQKGPTPPDPK